MNEDAWTWKNPQVRAAVKDLLRASDHLRAAYSDWLQAPTHETRPLLERVAEAHRLVDHARKRVHAAEHEARAALERLREKSWSAH